MAQHIYKDCDEWLDEIEITSMRRERFENVVYECSVDTLTLWLHTAWELGKASAATSVKCEGEDDG